MTLSTPTFATVARAQGIGTIRDDDVAPRNALRAFSDFDGDGKSDLALFRPAATSLNWFARLSATGFTSSFTVF